MSDAPLPAGSAPTPSRIEALLAHRDWVRALARSLVRDDSSADDVEQQTWQAAIENPPEKPGSVRAWLGSVVRRTVLDSQRRHARRRRRETAAARPEGQPSAADVVARVEIDRAVVNSVAELPEPYRTTLLLRFYDGLPPREVATRTGVPVETARSRVRRGLERVRTMLDEQNGGDREAWKAALVPFLAGPVGPAPAEPAQPAPSSPTPTGGAAAGGAGLSFGAAVAAGVAALALGVWGGSQIDTRRPSDGEAQDALLAAERALDADRDELLRLKARVRTLRKTADEIRRTPAEPARPAGGEGDGPSAVPVKDAPARAAFVRPFRFRDHDALLADVDWDALGEEVARMIPLLGEVYGDLRAERPLRSEAVGEVQVHNGVLLTVVGPLQESFPGGASNAALTHPSFAATLVAAVCHVRDLPLTAEQNTALDRVAQSAADEVSRAVHSTSTTRTRLDALIEEAEAKERFTAAVRTLLAPEQRSLLGSDAARGVLGFDLFGAAPMWVGRLETLRFTERTDVPGLLASGLVRELELDAQHEDALRAVAATWFGALPEEFVGRAPAGGPDLESAPSVELVLTAARHTADLMRRVGELELNAEQRQSVRNSRHVLLLRRAQ